MLNHAVHQEMRILEDDLDAKLAREEAELDREEKAGLPGTPDKRLALVSSSRTISCTSSC